MSKTVENVEDGYSLQQKLVLKEYFAVRNPDDLDLVTITSYLIRDTLGQQYADIFLNDIDINSVKNRLPMVQRVIINKYFILLLLRFKGITNTSIVKPMFLITNEGTHQDWFTLVSTYIVPFIKEYSVMKIVYNIQN